MTPRDYFLDDILLETVKKLQNEFRFEASSLGLNFENSITLERSAESGIGQKISTCSLFTND